MADGRRTRRDVLTTGAAAAGAALAGCTSAGFSGGETPSGEGYSVTMEPVGEVTFDGVPKTFAAYEAGYADMGVALGLADGLLAVGVPSRFDTSYYSELDGVSVDTSSLTPLYSKGIDKEVFYKLGADVHLIDPQWLVNNGAFSLERKDVTEIGENVAPFFGNTIFRRTDEWHDYRYYTMYEAFEKVARVFKRTDRYEALRSIHDEMLASVKEKRPPAAERPDAMLVYAGGNKPESFMPYRLSGRGTNKKPFRDLGIGDALKGTDVEGLSTSNRGQVDYETLLEVDPAVLLVRGHESKTEAKFRNTVLAFMRNHDVASQLTAVQKGRVFRGGPIYQGPLQNLFLTERFATLFYPDRFQGELFDRAAVSAAVHGER